MKFLLRNLKSSPTIRTKI